MQTPSRSPFVTITAWVSLALALLGVVTGVLQGVMLRALGQDRGLLDALAAGAGGLAMPPPVLWVFDHLGLLLLLSVLSSALWAAASWGLLKRREWGRFGFIVLLAAGALLAFAGAFAFDRLLAGLDARAGLDPAGIDPLLANMQAATRVVMYGGALLIALLHAAIAWKLCTPAVRAEFR